MDEERPEWLQDDSEQSLINDFYSQYQRERSVSDRRKWYHSRNSHNTNKLNNQQDTSSRKDMFYQRKSRSSHELKYHNNQNISTKKPHNLSHNIHTTIHTNNTFQKRRWNSRNQSSNGRVLRSRRSSPDLSYSQNNNINNNNNNPPKNVNMMSNNNSSSTNKNTIQFFHKKQKGHHSSFKQASHTNGQQQPTGRRVLRNTKSTPDLWDINNNPSLNSRYDHSNPPVKEENSTSSNYRPKSIRRHVSFNNNLSNNKKRYTNRSDFTNNQQQRKNINFDNDDNNTNNTQNRSKRSTRLLRKAVSSDALKIEDKEEFFSDHYSFRKEDEQEPSLFNMSLYNTNNQNDDNNNTPQDDDDDEDWETKWDPDDNCELILDKTNRKVNINKSNTNKNNNITTLLNNEQKQQKSLTTIEEEEEFKFLEKLGWKRDEKFDKWITDSEKKEFKEKYQNTKLLSHSNQNNRDLVLRKRFLESMKYWCLKRRGA